MFGIQRQHTDPLIPIKDPRTFVVGCVDSQLFFFPTVIQGDINSHNKTSMDFLLDGLFLIRGAGAGIQPGPVTWSITGHSDGLYTEVKCTDIKSPNDVCVFLINYCLSQS